MHPLHFQQLENLLKETGNPAHPSRFHRKPPFSPSHELVGVFDLEIYLLLDRPLQRCHGSNRNCVWVPVISQAERSDLRFAFPTRSGSWLTCPASPWAHPDSIRSGYSGSAPVRADLPL